MSSVCTWLHVDVLQIWSLYRFLFQTSFLQAILGELPFKEGSMKVRGRLAYASQQAWVYNGSVQENIIFGKDYDETRYKEVIKVCALEKVGFIPMEI